MTEPTIQYLVAPALHTVATWTADGKEHSLAWPGHVHTGLVLAAVREASK